MQDEVTVENSGNDINKKTILIVEDDPILSRMYSEKFNYEGFAIEVAKDGQEALEIASTKNVDLILLDIMLPKMSGTDFLKEYKSASKDSDVPVIVLTNLAEDTEKQKAQQLGVKEYLVKAMQTPEQVVEKIKKYI